MPCTPFQEPRFGPKPKAAPHRQPDPVWASVRAGAVSTRGNAQRPKPKKASPPGPLQSVFTAAETAPGTHVEWNLHAVSHPTTNGATAQSGWRVSRGQRDSIAESLDWAIPIHC